MTLAITTLVDALAVEREARAAVNQAIADARAAGLPWIAIGGALDCCEASARAYGLSIGLDAGRAGYRPGTARRHRWARVPDAPWSAGA